MPDTVKGTPNRTDRHAAAKYTSRDDGSDFIINTPVATLWVEPDLQRPLDEASVSAVSDIRKWVAGMTLEQKLWLVGKLETQALYGQSVQVQDTRDRWVKVIVPGQRTSRDERGYPGWMPLAQLAENGSFAGRAACPIAVVRSGTAQLFHDPAGHNPFLEISFNTRLPVVGETESCFAVQTPADGTKYLPKTLASAIREESREASLPTDGTELVRTAQQFLGLPYLWSGVSGFGFDCSGFTHSLYDFYGISIPRDASDQIKAGRHADPDGLRPGDLLFFADKGGRGKVHHVGIYAEEGTMIHAPNSKKSIERIPLATPEYADEFAGARRYLPE